MNRIHLEELLRSPREIARFRALLSDGGVAAIPTETFYALAANPTSEAGVARIFRAKGRDDGKPLLTLFSERSHLVSLGIVADATTLDHFLRIWPAPLTVVLPLRRPIAASRSAPALGVRMPADAAVLRLLSAVGPLTGTSANRSGRPALSDPDAVAAILAPDLDLLVDGGPTPGGDASTVIDATVTPPVVLRPGAIRWPAPEK